MSESTRLTSIQILRGLAASMVVLHHYAFYVGEYSHRPSWIVQSGLGHLGSAGVDLFFVISGFIMVYTTGKKGGRSDASAFLRKRALRIYPLYWLWTTVLLAMWLLGIALKSHHYPVLYLFASYALIPILNEGIAHPLLDQGWTLSFEMLFYLEFTLTILTRLKHWRLAALALAFGALFLLGAVLPANSGIQGLFRDPIVFEFLFGVLAAEIVLCAPLSSSKQRWSRILAPSCLILGAALLAASMWLPAQSMNRCFAYGIPSFLIILGAGSWVNAPSHGLLVFLGDASYSIYLTHAFMVMAYGMALKKMAWLANASPDLLIVIATILTIAICATTYVVVERPLMKRLLGKKKAVTLQRSAV